MHKTRSHPEMVGDMSRVTLNTYQKFLLYISSQGKDLYLRQKIRHVHLLVLI